MEELLLQENVVNCEGNNVGGMGIEACPFDWDRITAVIYTKPSFIIDEAVTLDYINENVQQGNFHIVNGYDSFTSTTPDPNINTVEGSGYQQVMGEMPTSYTGVLNVGVERWKALRTLNGKDKFNAILVDVAGNIIYTKTKAGASKGFGLKMLFTGMYKGKEGNNPSSQTQMLQFSQIKEMERMTYITSENLDFDPSDLNDWNPINIVFVPAVAGGSTLQFSAKLVDNSHNLLGLAIANLRVTKTAVGSTAVITPTLLAYNSTSNLYTLTLPTPVTASGDVYEIKLYDATLQSEIIKVSDVLYGGEATIVIS